jgi:hypothetical protein
MTPASASPQKKFKSRFWFGRGLTNREIGKIVSTSEQVIKNHLRSAFDKLGVWSRLELAMYVASHGGKNWPAESERHVVCHITRRSGPIRPRFRLLVRETGSHLLRLYQSLPYRQGRCLASAFSQV